MIYCVKTVLLIKYADDNILSYANENVQFVKLYLELEAEGDLLYSALKPIRTNFRLFY